MTALATTLIPTRRADQGTAAGETLGELLQRRARAHGDRTYLAAARDDGVLTFASAARWCDALTASALPSGSTVAVSVSDPLQCAAFLIAAVASGIWVAPFDPATPDTGPSGLASLMARTGADVVVADRPAPADAPSRWFELADLVSGGAANAAPAWAEGGATAQGGIVLSSSGTTGPPKVMRLRQDMLLHTARSVVAHHRLTARDRGFNPLPLFHINAEVVGLLSTLVAGASLVLDDRFHRTGFWDLVGDRGVTWINAVPAVISRLAQLRPGERVPSGIRFVRSASAPLAVATADRFETATGLPIIETYGMTEAASQIAAHPLSVPRRAGSVGVPVGLELRVVRQDGEAEPGVCRRGELGEVEIRGASVIDAYEGGGHADRFRPGGWLRTGDLGRLDDDGFLYLVARTDDVINRSGEKVYPREIEEIIGADGAVVSVAVVGRDDPELGQVPVAYVVLHGIADAAGAREAARVAARLDAELTQKLVRSRRPVALHVVASMPAGATGKVRRHALGERATAPLFTFPVG